MPPKRAETYLKEGNAEILRLRTEDHRIQGADYSEQSNQNADSVFRVPLNEAHDKITGNLSGQDQQRHHSTSISPAYLGHFIETERGTKAEEKVQEAEQKSFKDTNARVENDPSKVIAPRSAEEVAEVLQRPSSIDQVRVRRDTGGIEDVEDSHRGDRQEETLHKKSFELSPQLNREANLSESINEILRNRVEDGSRPSVDSVNTGESYKEILRRSVENSRSSVDRSSSSSTSKRQSVDSLPPSDANALTNIQEGNSSKLTHQLSKESNEKNSSQPTSHSSSAKIRRSNPQIESSQTTDELIQEILDNSQPAKMDQALEQSASVDAGFKDEQSISTQNGKTSSDSKLAGEKSLHERFETFSVLQDGKPTTEDAEPEKVETKISLSNASELISDRLPSDVNGAVSKMLNLQSQTKQQPSVTESTDPPLSAFLVEKQLTNLDQGEDTISLPGSLSMATQTDRHQATQTDLLCLLRPEPRRTKSENDDSSDSEPDGGKN